MTGHPRLKHPSTGPSPSRRSCRKSAVLVFLATSLSASAEDYTLVIADKPVDFTGRAATAVAINRSVPGPTLHWREGEDVSVRVVNRLDEPTSIHWHGIVLPAAMDGVPGISFAEIAPGGEFTYRFTLRQSGTYWYHSHSGLQEQAGMYAPIVIHPRQPEPYVYERDLTVMLSDWTDESPRRMFERLKKLPGYYNFQKRTLFDFFRDGATQGWGAAFANRLAWGEMRMDPTDIADVTGHAYTYLMNGLPPERNWTGLFRPGERVRLRFVNASAMTYFDLRIPGLAMTVVQADGQDVQPVTVDELRIAVAETYDVIVQPRDNRAYTVFAEAMDRSGHARGSLAPRPGMAASIPAPRRRPLLSMADMGMDHAGSAHGGGHAGHGDGGDGTSAMHHDHAAMGHEAGTGMDDGMQPLAHGPDHHGAGNAMVAMVAKSRLDEPGIGLEDSPDHRVLRYADLKRLHADEAWPPPEREILLHLTGNMERFMWSFDGKKYAEAEPIRLRYGERIRFTLVNDTMMNHPIHLHGLWSDLVNGSAQPRKHVINVKPAERVSFDVTADALGEWAFHCHLLYHMEAGMFRKVIVETPDGHDHPADHHGSHR